MDARTAFRLLADGLSREPSRDFFPWLSLRLASIVEADVLAVVRVLPGGRMARTLSLCVDGAIVDNVDYALAGTPCEKVTERRVCLFGRDVAGDFPDDVMLVDLGAEAYLGVPVLTPDDRLVGLVAAIYRRPLTNSGVAQEVLSIAAARVGSELANQQAEFALASTERQLADTHHQLARTNRALTLLRLVNRVVIRSADETALLSEVCRLAVEEGGYQLAWTGVAQDDEQRIMPLTCSGEGREFLDECHFSWAADRPEGQAPCGRCIREQTAQLLSPLVTSPAYAPFADVAERYGLATEVALPLHLGSDRQGVLVLLMNTALEVSDDELALLQELADNLSWGVSALRLRREQERMQQVVLDVAEAVTARSNDQFFDHLARRLAGAMMADAALIARIDDGVPLSASMLAGVVDGQPVENFSFEFSGIPCGENFHDAERIIPRWVTTDFPLVERLVGGPFQAWVDRRLEDASGDAIGVIILLFRQPLLADSDSIRHLLSIFAAGAAAELERRRSDTHIRHLAYFDPGTGLPNRVHFMERLHSAILQARREGHRLALMFLDLNRFKEINDSQGHDVGDEVLREVATRFDACLAPGESLARLGGDEFVVMVEQTEEIHSAQVVGRLLNALASPILFDGHRFNLDVSIGVAFYPEDGDGPRELLKNTDIAMYHAKECGSGYRFYAPEMGHDLRRRLMLATRLKEALKNEKLELCYQPIIALDSGSLVGAEVLCRWFDNELGWISPTEFIAVAEERGMISELGEWVMSEACRQLAQWEVAQLAILPERLYVNLAAAQFEEPQLTRQLCSIVERAGVSPGRLGLEITESGFMQDPEQAVRITEQLRERGFALSIDDFGTGYSSLAYLKRFAAHAVKIDKSFVSDMLTDNNDYSIVATIIAMAERLGLRSVAEGVETPGQAKALKSMGCHLAQGYLFSHPLNSDEFERLWLAEAQHYSTTNAGSAANAGSTTDGGQEDVAANRG
ncbi:putative bifunctional diguanylate cyclase/phosphodiesterase [Halomonas huangheensis]|uniref:Diguanylate cyclase n=1 Tax=Halomonas huangheensis TaxID=1178482 RepID=W1N6I8_9GAMM|nr:EAL domain-containing protein [Halomonas huangheensis]ALM54227.1 hypothetical protein AR456_19610 [Halomonas huangheensis]ERL50771.1 hypothetical protein BJB45_19440 [Halomonas huangheensis]